MIAEQIAGCRARHTRLGLAQKFLDGFDDLLRDAATLIPLDKPPVILTGEYIPENLPAEPRKATAGACRGCSISAT